MRTERERERDRDVVTRDSNIREIQRRFGRRRYDAQNFQVFTNCGRFKDPSRILCSDIGTSCGRIFEEHS